jgi:acyl CoA:acetate/3-ketoacid CoA transferase beta subunit
MTHCSKRGDPKVLPECTLPLTGVGVVDLIITDRCVFDVTPDGLVLTELAEGETPEGLREVTGASFRVAPSVRSMIA